MKKIFIAILLFFSGGRVLALATEPKRLEIYGIANRAELELIVDYISFAYNLGANPLLLRRNLLEISAVESAFGTADYAKNRGYGYGIWQFDKVAFNDIKNKIIQFQSGKFMLLCGRDIKSVTYEMLQNHALIACFFARTYLYYKIPEPIGATLEDRARQWKTYYNTDLGKGTIAQYIIASANV